MVTVDSYSCTAQDTGAGKPCDGDQAVGAFGLICDKGDAFLKEFFVEFRIIRFFIIRIKHIDITARNTGQENIMRNFQVNTQQNSTALL